MMHALQTMRNFDEETLPDLDVCTLGALELFMEQGVPSFDVSHFSRPLVLGSGNAKVTAHILFAHKDALFADENSYQEVDTSKVDGVLVFSASGEKHAPLMISYFKKLGLEVYLITCSSKSSGGALLDENHVVVTPKNREPYTYNTSTYMGWILANSGEDPKEIHQFITEQVAPAIPSNIGSYFGYLLVTPNHLASVNALFETKFIELFGRTVARDVKTFEELKHAITVVPSEQELCIRFGEGNVIFEHDMTTIPLPENCGPATLMAVGYYVIGHIQKGMPPYFKRHIREYLSRITGDSFGKHLSVVVE